MWMWAKQVIIYLLVLSMVACNSQAMFNTKDEALAEVVKNGWEKVHLTLVGGLIHNGSGT